MAGNKKPRKKYKPKPILQDPVGYVTELLQPVAQYGSYLLNLQLQNSASLTALLKGTATRRDMDILIAMSNITQSLRELGFGKEYQDVTIGGREAIIGIAHRAKTHGRFTPTGTEIQQLNALMELHDAQMEIITVQDMDIAIAHAKAGMKESGVIKVSTLYMNSVQ